jgi:hypothetical protein
VHHQDLDDDQAPPAHAAVARIEDELAGVPGPEDLELVVGGNLQRVDERLVDLLADLGSLLLEEWPGQIDLDCTRVADPGLVAG